MVVLTEVMEAMVLEVQIRAEMGVLAAAILPTD